jgi:hypothetical protein
MGEVAREGKAMTKLGRIFAHETHEKHERRTEIFGVAREWAPMADEVERIRTLKGHREFFSHEIHEM